MKRSQCQSGDEKHCHSFIFSFEGRSEALSSRDVHVLSLTIHVEINWFWVFIPGNYDGCFVTTYDKLSLRKQEVVGTAYDVRLPSHSPLYSEVGRNSKLIKSYDFVTQSCA